MITNYLLWIFSFIAIVFALSTIFQRNPVYSAASLIVVMIALAVNYLILNAEFIAAIQVIVYAGAIMVLFVFVVMLLNIKEVSQKGEGLTKGRLFGIILTVLFGIQLFVVAMSAKTILVNGDLTKYTGLDNTKIIGKVLFSDYLLPFEVVSIVLIVGVIGAVVLAKSKD